MQPPEQRSGDYTNSTQYDCLGSINAKQLTGFTLANIQDCYQVFSFQSIRRLVPWKARPNSRLQQHFHPAASARHQHFDVKLFGAASRIRTDVGEFAIRRISSLPSLHKLVA